MQKPARKAPTSSKTSSALKLVRRPVRASVKPEDEPDPVLHPLLLPFSILRKPAVLAITGLSYTDLYEQMKNGTFPQSIQLGGRTVGWRWRDVLQWIETRPASRPARPVGRVAPRQAARAS